MSVQLEKHIFWLANKEAEARRVEELKVLEREMRKQRALAFAQKQMDSKRASKPTGGPSIDRVETPTKMAFPFMPEESQNLCLEVLGTILGLPKEIHKIERTQLQKRIAEIVKPKDAFNFSKENKRLIQSKIGEANTLIDQIQCDKLNLQMQKIIFKAEVLVIISRVYANFLTDYPFSTQYSADFAGKAIELLTNFQTKSRTIFERASIGYQALFEDVKNSATEVVTLIQTTIKQIRDKRHERKSHDKSTLAPPVNLWSPKSIAVMIAREVKPKTKTLVPSSTSQPYSLLTTIKCGNDILDGVELIAKDARVFTVETGARHVASAGVAQRSNK